MQRAIGHKKCLFGLMLLAIFFTTTTFDARADGILFPPPSDGKAPRVAVPETEPEDWLAFVAYQGGYTFVENLILQRAPYVMLFKDGRILWQDGTKRGR